MAISEDDLRGLSAVERETLLAAEADDTDGDIAQELSGQRAAAAPAAGAAAAAGEEAETTAEEDAAAAAAAATAAAAAAAGGEGAGTQQAAGEGGEGTIEAEVEEPDPAPSRAAPADITEQREALNKREDESMQKLLDGEITQEEHAKTKNEVRAALDALLVAEATDKATEKIQHDAMLKTYQGDLRETIKLGKAVGLDYKDEKLGPQFDRAVRMFSQELAEQGIYDSPGNLANSKQALADAHAFMMMKHGKTPAAAPAAAPAPAAKTPAAAPRPPADRSKLPPTLAGVPTAADARITSEFAHLEGITEPAALERELAKLSPDAQERYLGP